MTSLRNSPSGCPIIEDYSARTLRDLRCVGEHFTAADISAAEEAGVTFTVLYVLRSHPEKFRDLLVCLEGKRPASLSGLHTRYRDEEGVALATAIRRRGRILVSDAQITLGQRPAAERSTASAGSDQTIADLTTDQEVEIARKVLTDPSLVSEVMEDPEVCDAAYLASRERQSTIWAEENPEIPGASKERRPSGNLAKMSITASTGKAKLAVDDWVSDLRRVAEVDDRTRDFVHATTDEIRTRLDEADSLADSGSVVDEASEYLNGEV